MKFTLTDMINSALVSAILVMLVLSLSGCATTDERLIMQIGYPNCRHIARSWGDKRHVEGFQVEFGLCKNRRVPERGIAHVIGRAKRLYNDEWTEVDPTHGFAPNYVVWEVVRWIPFDEVIPIFVEY